MSNQGGSKALLIRLGVLVVLGAVAIFIVKGMNSPLSISEVEVKRMVKNHELIGLTIKDAAKKLQSENPGTTDGTAEFEFDQVKGWNAGSLLVDVVNGRVTAATWKGSQTGETDVRQDQGDGTGGGAAQGQGAPTGIRAKNQTSSGGGPR